MGPGHLSGCRGSQLRPSGQSHRSALGLPDVVVLTPPPPPPPPPRSTTICLRVRPPRSSPTGPYNPSSNCVTGCPTVLWCSWEMGPTPSWSRSIFVNPCPNLSPSSPGSAWMPPLMHRLPQGCPVKQDAPSLKGTRLPILLQRLQNPDTLWSRIPIPWHDRTQRAMEIASVTALWYRSGHPLRTEARQGRGSRCGAGEGPRRPQAAVWTVRSQRCMVGAIALPAFNLSPAVKWLSLGCRQV